MKKLTLLLVAMVVASINLMALEPISVIVKSNSGQGLSAQLVDYGNSQDISPLYTESLPTTSPNSSGLIPFIIGSGEQDWAEIEASNVTAYYVLNILNDENNIIAQYRLDKLIQTSAQAGVIGGDLKVGGNVQTNGFFSLKEAGTFTDSTELSGLTGNIFEYVGNDPSDEVSFDVGDLNPNIPNNTLIYIVNNSSPDDPSESDVINISPVDSEESGIPIFPGTAAILLKVGDNYFIVLTFPFNIG